ncbi:MAG: cytochrome c peroxidase [Bacteroidia bacterium]|jgi:cytochrome c peroxidase|tara:strand:- start:1019 stop:2125 length:1107 start_codon:yes stop_codon:yes gene_type:complete
MQKLLFFISIAATLVACKDVINEVPNTPFNTTPYTFGFNQNLMPPVRVPKDNPLTQEGVELGRMLFYDPILSADSTQSCSSCHNQKDGFTDNGLPFSVGIRGTIGKRNSMSIANLMWHLDGFFWDGRSDILSHQALLPIQDPTEMDETIGNVVVKLSNSPMYKEAFEKAFGNTAINDETIGKSLEQFMLTLVSANSKFDRVMAGLETFTVQEQTGRTIFNAEAISLDEERNPNNPQNFGADCFHCHGNSLFMSREYMTNGLPNVTDLGRGGVNGNARDKYKFKTTTLRNIEKTGPYMHDGRFGTLEEVVQHYLGDMSDATADLSNEPNMHALRDSVYLSEDHKAALVSFLKTLTDEEFLTKEEYSNPF